MIWDTFMLRDELDMLECRLTELQEVDDLKHVIVEAAVDHQGHPKPLAYMDNRSRFDRWNARIIHVAVAADALPSAAQNSDPWSREKAQREHTRWGLRTAEPDDIVLHGDLDEIPTATAAAAEPYGGHVLEQRFHCWAVDWLHPDKWPGTVGLRYCDVTSFSVMRDARNWLYRRPDAGWHFQGLGGPDAILRKLESFCHLEAKELSIEGVKAHAFYENGFMPGDPPRSAWDIRQLPVTVDKSWPKYVYERRCPESWFRSA